VCSRGLGGSLLKKKTFIQEREDEEPAPDKKEDDRVDFTTTSSEKAFEDVLQGFYSPLEAWYCRTVLDKVSGCCSSGFFF